MSIYYLVLKHKNNLALTRNVNGIGWQAQYLVDYVQMTLLGMAQFVKQMLKFSTAKLSFRLKIRISNGKKI